MPRLDIQHTRIEGREEYRSLEGIQKHPLWQEMSQKQKKFMLEYLRTGDKVKACYAGYNVTNDNSAQATGSKILKTFACRVLASIYYGHDITPMHVNKGELMSLISTRLRDPKISNADFRTLTIIYSNLRGWVEPSATYAKGRGDRFIKPKSEGGVDPASTQQELIRLIQQYEADQKEDDDEEEQDEG